MTSVAARFSWPPGAGWQHPAYPTPVLAGLSTAGVIFLVWFLAHGWGPIGADAVAYWRVDPGAPYTFGGEVSGAFRYSPVAAAICSLVGWLPWNVFLVSWLVVLAACYVVIARTWALAGLIFLPILLSWYVGSLDIALAAALVAAPRWPALWAIALLTKVTPAVGLIWHAVRGEWRQLAIAVGLTAALVVPSMLLTPQLWVDWIRSVQIAQAMHPYAEPLPLPMRIALAVGVVAWGARTDRQWTVVAGGTLAVPGLDTKTIAMLAGVLAALAARNASVVVPRLPANSVSTLGETKQLDASRR